MVVTESKPLSSVISVSSYIRDYEVHFTEFPSFVEELASLPNSFFVVDKNVFNLYHDSLLKPLSGSTVMLFTATEKQKALSSVITIYDQLLSKSAKKNLNLVSIGGGITQDVTGFVASTLYRGIEWTFVPTTLLAMSDSCIGSKTSLNHGLGKNLLGTFYPPSRIYLHLPFVLTLSDSDFASGLGEMAKLRVMGGRASICEFTKDISSLLAKDMTVLGREIRACLLEKIKFMRHDEFDRGRRNLLNFGHCMGHALEAASAYNVPHGQAVIVGMLFANIVSQKRGLLSTQTEEKLMRLFLSLLIAPVARTNLVLNAILTGMKKDKKRIGKGLAIILLQDDYSLIKVTDLSEKEVKIALLELGNILL